MKLDPYFDVVVTINAPNEDCHHGFTVQHLGETYLAERHFSGAYEIEKVGHPDWYSGSWLERSYDNAEFERVACACNDALGDLP